MSNEAIRSFQIVQDNCSYADPAEYGYPVDRESARAARGIMLGAALGVPLWVCIIAGLWSVI